MALYQRLPPDTYISGILAGDRYLLSRAITLTESHLPQDQQLAQQVMAQVMPHTGNSVRIGITGVPGVGKSSFIETFGLYLIGKGLKVAVLAIDPTSQRTKGSIMGDKTRMERLSQNQQAYIRPSASGSTLGGVARKTREALLLCEGAGYDVVLVETVGVGQSEITVRGMVDFFLLLMLAGAGDELQGIKKGIMEMADALVITKADGDNMRASQQAQAQYKSALHLFREEASGWHCPVMACSALSGQGIPEVWGQIQQFVQFTQQNGWFDRNRSAQNLEWMYDSIREDLLADFYRNPIVGEMIKSVEQEVSQGTLPAYLAARKLIELFKK